jgi:glutathione peroxidase-family protein
VFRFLTQSAEDSGPVYWNFESFLVDHKGHVARRYRTGVDLTSPAVLEDMEELLTRLPRHEDL